MSHTPGPWKWDGVTLRGKDRNCVLYPRTRKGLTPQDLVNNDSDALLIAAAPELYEALVALTTWSNNGEQLVFRTNNGIPMGMSKKQESLARTALAKVRGEL